MRTINMYGVDHAYPHENNSLDPFLRGICKALDIAVPVEHINNVLFIQKQALQSAKNAQESRINESWRENSERMGR